MTVMTENSWNSHKTMTKRERDTIVLHSTKRQVLIVQWQKYQFKDLLVVYASEVWKSWGKRWHWPTKSIKVYNPNCCHTWLTNPIIIAQSFSETVLDIPFLMYYIVYTNWLKGITKRLTNSGKHWKLNSVWTL